MIYKKTGLKGNKLDQDFLVQPGGHAGLFKPKKWNWTFIDASTCKLILLFGVTCETWKPVADMN